MPASSLWITHRFGGGWATDFGPSYYGAPERDGSLIIPFLVNARNLVYEFDGGPHKAPGSVSFNTTTLGATADVRGLFDYWRQGTGGTATQRIVAAVDTRLVQAQLADVAFTNLITGLNGTAVPQFSTFDDLLIFANDSVADVPRSWDQTTAQNLAGSPPNFSFSIPHKNRQWAAGVYANPSRLYYSVNLDPEDWAGVGSGSIDIDPNDGDLITGIISHKNDLWVFKGPYTGSIHRITGSAPTGSDAYARIPFIRGLSAAWINGIFRYGDDIGFVSPRGTVHSLAATAAFGDFNQSYLSYPINSHMRTELLHSRMRQVWAVNDPWTGNVLISATPSGASTNTRVFCMDYRFLAQGDRYPRWSLWDSFSLGSLAMVVDTSTRPRMWAGGYTGTVWKLDQATRTHNSTSISFQATTPFFTYGDEYRMKTIGAVGLGVQPKNSTNNITFGWARDNNAQQTATVTQGGGGALDSFVLGTDVLGGSSFVPRFIDLETGGEFRSIQYDILDNVNNGDIEVHSIATRLTPGAENTEN